ncbi:cysteine rich repeat-containing protein [Rhizobium sp. LjRoot258]|uniref:cysteine rich repeat-containing protein n=1 Tax=Rhizobium sp. LjRoot258 TaxID=3342299 RepID=UPI003ECE513C
MKTVVASLALIGAAIIQPAGAEDRLIAGFDVAKACSGDISKLCSGIEPGSGRIKECIKANAQQLSTACKEALAVMIASGKPVDVTLGAVEGKIIHVENAHNYPFCEFGLIIGDSFDTAEAHIFNTTGTSDCPSRLDDKIVAAGPEAFAREHGAIAGWLNPRRYWMFDEFWVYEVGNPHDFAGVMASWMGKLPFTALKAGASGTPYNPGKIYRNDTFKFKAGTTVYLLDAADGGTFVMQSWTDHYEPSLTYDKLKDLGPMYKKLPEGWKFRIKVLDSDLEVTPPAPDHLAIVMQDEFRNTFQGCGYDAACTYKP